ncbi:NAC domain-containing protein 19-like [Rhodamnia argentea]|uniref:NAC domain-containing protein 19-like n=1 Tax=Rhodamnia argentea TaxID=178133 RepID=A0A8B8QFP4_9MYRT|nr:NAC domain-containing protein 19-like [Rhodamnia argentea]
MADALPIGYRFCPSEEQLFYCLARRVRGDSVFPEFIREFDVYEKEPWEFYDENAEKSLYVFTKLKMKKSRVERTAGLGCWKGVKTTDIKNCHGDVLGHKRHFNFKVKDSSSSDSQNTGKGSWIMHEYSMPNQEIVLCKIIFKKEKSDGKQGKTLVIGMPIKIGENRGLKNSSHFINKIDAPHQDIGMEPSKTMCLGPHVKRQRLYCTGSKEDVLALASRPCLAISTHTMPGAKDSVGGGRRPMEQTFTDNATSNGIANLLASTIMEEDTDDGDGCQWILKAISFD